MKNILVFLFLVSIVTAQDKKLEMRITYPSDGDSLNISKARLGAWISDTLASVKINGKDTKVYGSGAFVDLFELKPGWNQFIISAKNKINTISDTLNLYRNLPLVSLPQSPTIFSKEKILPSSDLIFYDQDKLTVQFMGSPGGKASFEIDDLVDDPLPMMELPENQAGGLKGIYQGEYQIKNTDACVREEIIFYLEGKDSNEEELESDRFVTVKQTGQPFLVETKDESNLVFYRPGSEIFMELPQGIKLPVIVEYNRGFKIEVAPGKSGVISKNSVNVLPQGQVTPHAALYGIASGFENDWLVFSFNRSKKRSRR